ncbi:MAG: hypothetical protein ACLFUS_01915 [Candidatus Sumerlaeia bacterium]
MNSEKQAQEHKRKSESDNSDTGKGWGCVQWAIAAIPLFLILYCLGLGPAVRLHREANKLPQPVDEILENGIELVYFPLVYVWERTEDHLPNWLENALRWYLELWI